MLALPHVSGAECIAILMRLGYRPLGRSRGLASLRRATKVAVVPESATLSPAVIAAILRAADVDPLDFLRILEETPLRPSRMPPYVA